MYKLIITEKRSVGQSIAKALGAETQRDGYIEGNGFLISWCVGHLAELAAAYQYDERFRKWNKADLPIVPKEWRYSVPRNKEKQFRLVSKLMSREDVEAVVNACDAGREGELIFRNVYVLAGCKKPILRLWISSMENEAIREGFQNLRDGSEYDRLYQAALCRSQADWLVGINATRLYSVLYHRKLNIGRVMSSTLAMLVQREADIRAFKPAPFYTPVLNIGDLEASGQRYDDKADAEAVAAACGRTAVVTNVERREKTSRAPALFDLTTLQREANRRCGFTAQQTLDYLQSLYEKRLCTYPRTDSRYLTDDMEETVANIVAAAANICGVEAPENLDPGVVCDSSKVSDHHAIVPTSSASGVKLADLPAGEAKILGLVCWSVLRAVAGDCRYAETTVTFDCGGNTFTARGKSILEPGWTRYEKKERENTLPVFSEGQEVDVSCVVKEGHTTAPASFTEDTLLAAMERAGSMDMPEDAGKGAPTQAQRSGLRGEKEGQQNGADARRQAGGAEWSLPRRGIGTPATRAGIIEKLIASGFIERMKSGKQAKLVPSRAGISLITVLPEQLQSPQLTAEWEHRLKMIERGELAPATFLYEIEQMLRELIYSAQPVPGAEVLFPSGREALGKCPRCGSAVTESKAGFFCEAYDCKFALWKDNPYLTAKRLTLTKDMVKSLLSDGQVMARKLYSSRTDSTYDAILVLDDDGQRARYHLSFDFDA